MTSNNAKLGILLVDGGGVTLYTLTNAGKPVACTGACATIWPPLLLHAGATTPNGAAGVSGLGSVAMNGGVQVTEDGDPLYRYSGDTGPGDANGEGLNSFGGVWHVARTAGASSSTAPVTAAPTTQASSAAGGYGGYGG
jgi:predicted lipoprotein with Yx(FWY)xxD motif